MKRNTGNKVLLALLGILIFFTLPLPAFAVSITFTGDAGETYTDATYGGGLGPGSQYAIAITDTASGNTMNLVSTGTGLFLDSQMNIWGTGPYGSMIGNTIITDGSNYATSITISVQGGKVFDFISADMLEAAGDNTIFTLTPDNNPAHAVTVGLQFVDPGNPTAENLSGNPNFKGISTLTITAVNNTMSSNGFTLALDNIVLNNIGGSPPTTTISTASLSADTGTTPTDFITKMAAQTINGTLSANLATGESVEVSYDGGSSWANATTYSVGSAVWSTTTTLSGTNTFEARVTNATGSSPAYTHTYTLDTTPPAITFSNLAFSADTGSSSTDFITKTSAQTISATLSGAPAGNDIVYGSLDNGSTWTDITAKVAGMILTWNGVTLTTSSILKLKVTDNAGNDGAVASQVYVLDSTSPTTTIASAAFSNDLGSSSTDFITRTAFQNITGTLSANLAAGEAVKISLDNGTTWSAAAATVGQSTWALNGQTLSGNNMLKVKVTDTAGNDGTVYSQAYVLDNTAPAVSSVSVPANATYTVGQNLDFTVNWSENVTVTGADSTLELTIGSVSRSAAYLSKTANSITYRYTAQGGDSDTDGITIGILTLNTTTITDTAGNNANLALNAVGSTAAVLVNAAPPTLSTPTLTNLGTNQATLTLQSDATGRGYFTLLAGSGTVCGTGTQVKNGQNSTGGAAFRFGSLPLAANTSGNYTVRNLTQSSNYTVCFTADDGTNLQATPATINFATTAAIDLTTSAWTTVGSAEFTPDYVDYTSPAFAPDGTPYLAFSDGTAYADKATVMKFDGASWVAVGGAGFSADAAEYTSLAFAPDGTPYLAYKDWSNGGKTTVMKYDGASWVNVGSAAFSAGNTTFTSLAFAPDGTPYLAYEDFGNANKATVMKYDGTSWVNVGSPGFSANLAAYTSLAFAPDGTPYLAYSDNGNGAKATVKKYDGASWIDVGSAGFSASLANYTSLAFAPDGTPYLAYVDNAYGGKATVMKFDGAAWVTVGSAGFSAGNTNYTSLAFAPDSTPYVAYKDYGNGNKTTVMKYNGASWVVAGSAAFSTGSVTYTALAFAPDGTPCVAYSDASTGSGKATVMKLAPAYTVTYNGNGNTTGSVPVDATAYLPAATVTVAPNSGSLSKTGYTFTGWNTAADGSGITYAASGSATFTMGAGNVTLYAQWSSNAYLCTSANTTVGSTTANFLTLGNSFAASCTGGISSIDVKLGATSSISGGTLNIYSGESVDPANLLYTQSGINLGSGIQRIILTTPLAVTSGNTYTYTITSGVGYSVEYSAANPYAAGKVYAIGGGFIATADLYFSIIISDVTAPTITSGTLAGSNAYIDIVFSEGIYGANDGATPLTADKLALTFTRNGGSATNATISSVKKNNNIVEGSATALSGGETTVRVFLNITGTPSGTETIEIKPVSGTSVYDFAGNAMPATQTTGLKTLNDNTPPSLTTPTTANVGANQATLILQSNATGTGYFTILAGSGTACGTGTQVKSGQTGTGAAAFRFGSLPLSANTQGSYTVRNLIQSSNYTICFTADDGVNLQATPSTVNFTTSAAINLTMSAWTTVGSAGFTAGEADYISLAFTPDGNPYVAYSEDVDGTWKATVEKYDGTNWVTVGSAGFSAGQADFVSLAFAPDGTPFVAYSDAANGSNATVMKYDGTAWVDVGSAGFSAGGASYTSLSFAPDGTPYVAYKDVGNSSKATVKKYDGTAWIDVGSAGFSAGAAEFVSPSFAPDGTPYAAYKDVSINSEVAVMKYDGTGPTGWVEVGSAGFSAGATDSVSLAFAPDGNPYVAYSDYNTVTGKITVMRYNGTGWVTVGNAGFSAGRVQFTSLAFAPDGNPYVAYSDDSDGPWKATVKRYDGAAWGDAGSAGFSAGGAYYTSLSFAPDGTPHVAYMDFGNSNKATVMKLAPTYTLTYNGSSFSVLANTGTVLNILGSNPEADGSVTLVFGAGASTTATVKALWTINPNTYVHGGNSVTITSNSGDLLTRTGYTLAGWNTAADGSGTSYPASITATFLEGTDVTLYAQWTINSYTVTYNGNGSNGGSVPVDGSHNYNTTVTVLANTGNLTRTGYTFAGWNTAADGSGTSYAASGSATFTMGTSNVILYAKWTINSPTITSSATATFTYGTASSFNVTTTGSPTLTNSGVLPLGVSFTDNGDGTATIAGTPNASGTFPIFITATNSSGSVDQSFTLTVNATASEVSAIDTNIVVTPDRHLFGVETLGSCSTPVTFTVRNIGGSPLTLGTLAFGGTDSGQFAFGTDSCSGNGLDAGASCSAEIKFCPTSIGSKTALLQIPSDAPKTPTIAAFLYNHESTREEATRRMPPVLERLSIPTIMSSGGSYTITWSLLGYDQDYLSRVAFFSCAGILAGNCGNSFAGNFADSGNIAPVSSVTGDWTYNGITSKRFNYSYSFTAPTVGVDTDIVIRFYRKSLGDNAAGKGSLSLLIPGNVLQTGTSYYDADGRRLLHTILAP